MCLRVLPVLIFTIVSVAQLADAQCTLQPKERKDCGRPGITKKSCEEKGCCFDSSINGVIWCYFSPQSTTAETTTQRTTSVQPGNGTMNASYAGNLGMAEVPLTTTTPVNTTNQTNLSGPIVGIGMAEVPLTTSTPVNTTHQTNLSGNVVLITGQPLPTKNTTLSSSVGPLWSHPSSICLISILLATIATMSDL